MIGKTILHYKILEKIGEGGMGVVYKAQDTKLKRDVAIKFLPRQIATSEEERERFKIEAQAAAALNHPNIATIYNIEEVDDETFIVMEYIEGRELKEIVQSGIPGLQSVIDYATQIAEGLNAAHKKDITHRDIKSSNIMITDDGQVKVMDFGLAKVAGGAQLTKDQSTLGTAAYMSPEQARGEEADHRSDIWAFGVVLYEMLAGKLPFGADYEQAVIYSILNEEPEPLMKFNTEIPDGCQNIIHKALAKDKSERYQGVTDLLEDLKALGRAKTISVAARKGKSTKRNYVFVGVGIVLLLAIFIIFSRNSTEFFGTKQTPAVDAAATQWTKSIAVLPFTDLSPQKDQEYFCVGMTEQIITNLSQLQNLKVIARTSVMKFKNTEKTIPEIAKELNVAHVLEGSIRKSGNQIRVTTQLVKAEDGYHIWARDYDRELKDIFAVQDDVSEAIATALLSKLSDEQVEGLRTKQTENVRAYEYYLKGRYFHDTRFWGATFKTEDFEKSRQMFEKAIELDPNYALAHAGLADLLDTYLHGVAKDKSYADLRRIHVERALELDPNSSYALTVRGFVLSDRHETDNAYESFRRALEVTPNDFDTNWAMGHFFFDIGLARQAVHFYTRAIEKNPLDAMGYFSRGESHLQMGNFDAARADYETALEIEADHIDALNGMAWLLILQGDDDRAEQLLIKCKQINPDYPALKISEAYLVAVRGEKEQALATHKNDIVYILLGMKEEALQQLSQQHEQAWQLGITGPRYGNPYLSLKNLSIYDSLRDDPRFIEILEKEEHRYEELMQKYGDLPTK